MSKSKNAVIDRFSRVRVRGRPKIAMTSSAIFILLGIAIITSGALLEGAGVLLVAACCSCIGINPSR